MPRLNERHCDQCKAWYRKQNKRFCSQVCRAAFWSGERIWNFDRGKRMCAECEKEYKFDYKTPNFRGRGKTYCGFSCKAKAEWRNRKKLSE